MGQADFRKNGQLLLVSNAIGKTNSVAGVVSLFLHSLALRYSDQGCYDDEICMDRHRNASAFIPVCDARAFAGQRSA